MAYIKVRKAIVTIGADGTGTADMDAVNGYLVAVKTDYSSAGASTDVTIANVDPDVTFLTITNSETDAVLAPRMSVVTSANAAITDGYGMFPVTGVIRVTVAGGTEDGTVAVWCFVEAES